MIVAERERVTFCDHRHVELRSSASRSVRLGAVIPLEPRRSVRDDGSGGHFFRSFVEPRAHGMGVCVPLAISAARGHRPKSHSETHCRGNRESHCVVASETISSIPSEISLPSTCTSSKTPLPEDTGGRIALALCPARQRQRVSFFPFL